MKGTFFFLPPSALPGDVVSDLRFFALAPSAAHSVCGWMGTHICRCTHTCAYTPRTHIHTCVQESRTVAFALLLLFLLNAVQLALLHRVELALLALRLLRRSKA